MSLNEISVNDISVTQKSAAVRELELVEDLSRESLRMLMLLMILTPKAAEKVLQRDNAKSFDDFTNEARRAFLNQLIETVDVNQIAIVNESTHVEPKSQEEGDERNFVCQKSLFEMERSTTRTKKPPRSGPNEERGSENQIS